MSVGTVITGEKNIAAVRLMTLRRGLQLEIGSSLRIGRGRSCFAILKDMGYCGNRKKVYELVSADVERLLEGKSDKG